MSGPESSSLIELALASLKGHPTLRPGDRVVAAMSGGVDSSVMAALLHRASYEVIGVSMQLFDKTKGGKTSETEGKCCTLDDFQDARRVSFEMGFPHYVVDFEARFRNTVIDEFVDGYLRGETPSPCIRCNQHVKFKTLLERADALGARFVATGHYARITHDDAGFHLLRGTDSSKDQSYFLFSHTQETLACTLFPLAGLTKPEVRQLGRDLGLHLAEKVESQEICFVTQNRYDTYIDEAGRAPEVGVGPIRHIDGSVLGSHQGYWRYTVGQRKGLGVAHLTPLYVLRVERGTNTVWVGADADLFGSKMMVRELSWCGNVPANPLPCTAKIRSRGSEAEAIVIPLPGNQAKVVFAEPQRAIAPGQAVVFYRDEEVLGGGWISSS
jgi:tRNA-specific 2-thiouridylase